MSLSETELDVPGADSEGKVCVVFHFMQWVEWRKSQDMPAMKLDLFQVRVKQKGEIQICKQDEN